MNSNIKHHPFHILPVSPWPLFTALAAFFLAFGFANYLHQAGKLLFLFGFISLVYFMYHWWSDVCHEGSIEGQHTVEVESNLRLGMILFIVSEVMFFFGFFWAFFSASLTPTIEIGSTWPPEDIAALDTWKAPFANTLLLLGSGVTITIAHINLVLGNRTSTLNYLILTVLLGIIFTIFQIAEYIEAGYSIADSIYGTTFYLCTGFHGFHVIIGTIFIIVCTVRLYNYDYTTDHHFGFEAAAWYWHFVDVVWLFLFVSIYWWGNIS